VDQFVAIIRYEILMAWRRRSLPLLWGLLLAGVLGLTALVMNVNQQIMASIEAQLAAQQITLEQFHTNTLFTIMIAAMICYSVGITLMVGEVIPLDVQFKVRELFETLPISRATYLGGKLLGVWGGIVLGWLLVGVISAIAFRLIIGTYDLRVFLILWVLLPLPASLTAAALSVLVASLVNSRRIAVVTGLLILPFSFYLGVIGVSSFIPLTALIDPIYTYGSPILPSRDQIAFNAVKGMLTQIGVVTGAWAIVLFVWRRRELRG
jgi:hypothetical protein